MIFKPKAKPADFEKFLAELAPVKLGQDYTKAQRYVDFRTVLMGTDAGRRVAWQIFDWCGLYRDPTHLTHPELTQQNIGKANVARQLLAIMNTEPSEPQGERAITQPEDDND
ncbi:MAG: hypothetical protein GY953_39340 [bacterium]|nr:hypothetical protein [bacterium]